MHSLFGLLNDDIGSSLYCDLVDQNANLGTFLKIDVNFFFLLAEERLLNPQPK